MSEHESIDDTAVLESVETEATLVDVSLPVDPDDEDRPEGPLLYRVTVRFDLREGAFRQLLMYFIREGRLAVSLLRQDAEADPGSPLLK